jgi:hypothetical protein
MSPWTEQQLDSIGGADELEISSRRADGSLHRWVVIWVVRVGDHLYVRSARGGDNPWFRWARSSVGGRIRSGGQEYEVTFSTSPSDPAEAIDEAYHLKYDGRYPAEYVNPVVGDVAATNTLELVLSPDAG